MVISSFISEMLTDLPSEYRGVLVFLAAIATESDTAWAPPAIGSSFLAATATGTLEVTLLSAGFLAPPRKIWFHSMYLIMVRFDATETSFDPWVLNDEENKMKTKNWNDKVNNRLKTHKLNIDWRNGNELKEQWIKQKKSKIEKKTWYLRSISKVH